MVPRRILGTFLAADLAVLLALGALAPKGTSEPKSRGPTAAGTEEGTEASAGGWVASWAASPVSTVTGLDDRTYRAVVTLAAGGHAVRVRFGGALSDSPAHVDGATIALPWGAGPGVVPGTTRNLTFGGRAGATIPAHGTVVSDPLAMDAPPGTKLAVTLYAARSGRLTAHPAAANEIDPSYVSTPGDHRDDVDGASFVTEQRSWLALEGVEVLPERPTSVVVAFGDSLTDGAFWRPSPDDTNWPTVLNERLRQRDAGASTMVVVSAAIGGNALLDGHRGPSGLDRFRRDVLGQPGVRVVVLLLGINDLGGRHQSADAVAAGDRTLIAEAHRAGIRVVAATLPPTGDPSAAFLDPRYSRPFVLAERAHLNRMIRDDLHADAVVDLDAVVRDPEHPQQWRPGLSDDRVHPTAAGAQAMAAAFVDVLPGAVAATG